MTSDPNDRVDGFRAEQLMLTIPEAARVLSVGRSTIYVLMNNESLHPVHIGRAVRISRAELERYVAGLDANVPTRPVDGLDRSSPAF